MTIATATTETSTMTKIIMAAAQSQACAPYQRHYINIIMARDQANESACRGAHFEPRGASSWPTPLAVRCLASEWIICLPEQTTTMRAVDSSDSPSAGASHFREGSPADPSRKYHSDIWQACRRTNGTVASRKVVTSTA